MKGTFKVTKDTVTIEEFSYPLEQFLVDEPDFKAPDADELFYQRGEGTLLFTGDKTEKAGKAYPADTIEIYIARKRSYRGAFKARRNAAALGQDWREEIPEEKAEEAETQPEQPEENGGNDGDGGQKNVDPDQDGNGEQPENNDGEGTEENADGNAEGDADANPENQDEQPVDPADANADEAGKEEAKAENKDEAKADKKSKSKKKDAKNGDN